MALIVNAILLFILASTTGFALSLSNGFVDAALLGVLVFIPFLYSASLSVYFLVLLTLVVSGLANSFFGVSQVQWGASLLGMWLFLLSLLKASFSSRERGQRSSDFIYILFFIFAFVCLLSSVVSYSGFGQALVGARTYLPYWGIFLVFSTGVADAAISRRVILILISVAAIQWIFCLYQKLYVVPARMSMHVLGSAWDSIVGTFSGSIVGGGESGSLGVFLVVILLFSLTLRASNFLTKLQFSMLLLSLLCALALTETKVVFVLIPIALAAAYPENIYKNPFKYIFSTALVVLVLWVLAYSYYYFFWAQEVDLGFVETLSNRMAYSFDPNFSPSANYYGRFSALIRWAQVNSLSDNPFYFALGHGIASSVGASSILGAGSAAKMYGLGLDATGASKLLWETGAFGFVLFISIFCISYFRVLKLKSDLRIPLWHRAALRSAGAAMPIIVIGIFYEVTAVSSPPMQLTAFFLVGYVSYWHRFLNSKSKVI